MTSRMLWAILYGICLSLLCLGIGYLGRPVPANAQSFAAPGRQNILVTVTTAGTPVRVTSAANLIVDRFIIQAAAGASVGLGYVCSTNGATPSSYCGGSGQLAAELAPATATAPGSSYSDTTSPQGTAGIPMNQYYIDCATSGAQFIVSFNVR